MKTIRKSSYFLWSNLCNLVQIVSQCTFMSTRFLKYKINGVRVTQFKLDYICDTTNHSRENLVKLCREVHYMQQGNKYLEQQECEDIIKSNKTIILAVIMLVPNKNP